jgi:hypothetical protein
VVLLRALVPPSFIDIPARDSCLLCLVTFPHSTVPSSFTDSSAHYSCLLRPLLLSHCARACDVFALPLCRLCIHSDILRAAHASPTDLFRYSDVNFSLLLSGLPRCRSPFNPRPSLRFRRKRDAEGGEMAPNAGRLARLLFFCIVLVPPFPSRLALFFCFRHELSRSLLGRL